MTTLALPKRKLNLYVPASTEAASPAVTTAAPASTEADEWVLRRTAELLRIETLANEPKSTPARKLARAQLPAAREALHRARAAESANKGSFEDRERLRDGFREEIRGFVRAHDALAAHLAERGQYGDKKKAKLLWSIRAAEESLGMVGYYVREEGSRLVRTRNTI